MTTNTILISLGRRKSQTFSYTIAAIGVMLMSYGVGTTFFSIIGRAAMMGSSSVTWLHTPEVLHTSYRGTGHAFANGVARVGAFLCPYVVGNFSVEGEARPGEDEACKEERSDDLRL